MSARDALNAAAGLDNGKAVLVGRSWGGLPISHVTEAVSDEVEAARTLLAAGGCWNASGFVVGVNGGGRLSGECTDFETATVLTQCD